MTLHHLDTLEVIKLHELDDLDDAHVEFCPEDDVLEVGSKAELLPFEEIQSGLIVHDGLLSEEEVILNSSMMSLTKLMAGMRVGPGVGTTPREGMLLGLG